MTVSYTHLDVYKRQLHSSGAEPKLMNFEWKNPSVYHHRVNFAAMGLSFAMFPTFCNSARTAAEVREVVRKWTIPPLAEKARIAWVNLGVHVERVQPRVATDVPVVLYPAISMEPRKQPERFLEIVGRVARKTPLHVEARLHESYLVSDLAMNLSLKDYALSLIQIKMCIRDRTVAVAYLVFRRKDVLS